MSNFWGKSTHFRKSNPFPNRLLPDQRFGTSTGVRIDLKIDFAFETGN